MAKSFNGINYFIFNIINNEYHIELFNAISIEGKSERIDILDDFIKTHPEYIKEEHEKILQKTQMRLYLILEM